MYYGKTETNQLDNLLSRDSQAKDYFMALGEAEQGMLRQRSNEIHSLDDMVTMARQATF